MQQELTIKISFEGRIKRLSMSPNYSKLCKIIENSFEEVTDGSFVLNYIDNELDTVEIEGQNDFTMAVNCAEKLNSILKIYVERREREKEKEKTGYSQTTLVKTSIQTSFIGEDQPFRHETYLMLKCEHCNRIFNMRKSYETHVNVCERIFREKRLPFNSHLMRMRAIAYENGITLLYLNTLFALRKVYPVHMEYERRECFLCKRRFGLNAFDVHIRTCKSIMTPRVPFESRKQRMTCEQELMYVLATRKQSMSNTIKVLNTLPIWKKASLRFRNIMKISRMLHRQC